MLLPFSIKVISLDYKIFAKHFRPENFTSLDIVTKQISFAIEVCSEDGELNERRRLNLTTYISLSKP